MIIKNKIKNKVLIVINYRQNKLSNHSRFSVSPPSPPSSSSQSLSTRLSFLPCSSRWAPTFQSASTTKHSTKSTLEWVVFCRSVCICALFSDLLCSSLSMASVAVYQQLPSPCFLLNQLVRTSLVNLNSIGIHFST